jgi:hypothetical protein
LSSTIALPAVVAAINAAMAALFNARGNRHTGFMKSRNRVIGTERIGATSQSQVVLHVLG